MKPYLIAVGIVLAVALASCSYEERQSVREREFILEMTRLGYSRRPEKLCKESTRLNGTIARDCKEQLVWLKDK